MNLYVGNLPFSTSSEDLAAMFRRFGEQYGYTYFVVTRR